MFSRSIIAIAISIPACLLSSCSGHDDARISMLAVKATGSESWQMTDPDRNQALDTLFGHRPTMAVNGFFSVKADNGTISVYTSGSASRPVLIAGGLASAGCMTGHRMPVSRVNSRIELIDPRGHTTGTLLPVDGCEITAAAPYFTDGLLVFAADVNGKTRFGAIDTDCNVVIRPIYDALHPFRHGTALAMRKAKGGKKRESYALISTAGDTIYAFPDKMTPLSDGVWRETMPVKNGNKIGFINVRGVFRSVPDSVKEIGQFTDRFFVYTNRHSRQGVMTIDGKDIIPPRYSEITIFNNRYFLARGKKSEKSPLCIMALDYEADTVAVFPGAEKIMSLRNVFPFTSEFDVIGTTEEGTYRIFYPAPGDSLAFRWDEFESVSTAIIIDPVETASGDMIRSDYFDSSEAVDALMSRLSAGGYGPADIGSPLSNLVKGTPDQHIATVSNRFVNRSIGRFSLKANAYSSKPIVMQKSVYSDGNTIFGFKITKFEGFENVFDPSATIDKIEATLSTPGESYRLILPAVEDELADKGFRQIESTAYLSLYESASDPGVLLMVCPAHESRGMELVIMTRSIYEQQKTLLRRHAELNLASTGE